MEKNSIISKFINRWLLNVKCQLLRSSGFTLVEILVVVGLVVILFATGMFVSFDFYKGSLLDSERDFALGALNKARSRAMSNFYEVSHGVHIDQDKFVIFRGNVYNSADSSNEIIPGNPNVQKGGATCGSAVPDIVFSQLSGVPNPTCSPECIISLCDGVKSKLIKINNEGRINW